MNSAFQLFNTESHRDSKFVQLLNVFSAEDDRHLASQRFAIVQVSDQDNCDEKTLKKKVSADIVKLSGVLCGLKKLEKENQDTDDKVKVRRFTLKNKTNSTSAEVFVEEDNTFGTETITLSPGIDNHIDIEFIYSNGDRFQKKISLFSQPKK